MTDCPTITATEIAELLSLRRATFLRNRYKMERKGFPRPLPTGSQVLVWSRALVLAWINSNGVPDLLRDPAADPVAAARAVLEQRIGGAA